MSNGTEPNSMTNGERLDEVAQVLAAGILRLRCEAGLPRKKREFCRDNCLEIPPETRPPAVEP